MTHAALISDAAHVDALRLPWHSLWLETRDAALFQSYAWFAAVRHAAQAYPAKFAVLVAGADGQRRSGLLPIMIEERSRRRGRTRWRFPIPEWVPTFAPIGPEPTRTWLAALSCIAAHRSQWATISLHGIDCRHVDARRLETACEFRSFRPTKREATRWLVLYPSQWRDAQSNHESPAKRILRGACRITRVRPPRPCIVNGLVAAQPASAMLARPEEGSGQASGAFAEPAGSVWRTALERSGAATECLARYELYSNENDLRAIWLVAKGREHWALIGRWHAANGPIEQHTAFLLQYLMSEAANSGIARVWVDRAVQAGESGALFDYELTRSFMVSRSFFQGRTRRTPPRSEGVSRSVAPSRLRR